MADVILTFKIMPDGVEVNLDNLEAKAKSVAEKYGKVAKVEIEPVAFGLKAIMLTMIVNEDDGSTEPLEKDMAAIESVSSADIVSVGRALG